MSTFYFFQSNQRWQIGKVITSSFFALITPMISLNLGQNPNLDQTKNAWNIEKCIMAPERSGPKWPNMETRSCEDYDQNLKWDLEKYFDIDKTGLMKQEKNHFILPQLGYKDFNFWSKCKFSFKFKKDIAQNSTNVAKF